MDGQLHYLVTIDYLNHAYLFDESCEQVAELLLDSEDTRRLLNKSRPIKQVNDEIWRSSLDWISTGERQRAGCYVVPAEVHY